MEPFAGVTSLGDLALLAGLACTRVAVAFLVLPIFSSDTVPALVRNTIYLSIGLLTLALQPAISFSGWSGVDWVVLFAKEACIGLALGFGMASFLWAFSSAGQIVDQKVGTSSLQITDPTSGQQETATAALLGRLAGFLFMAGGGFSLFVSTLLESFRLWPLAQLSLTPRWASVTLFERHLGDLMSLSFMLASPVLVAMFAIDLTLGLVNRYAQQLNVSAVSSSLKGLASTAVLMLMLSTVAHGFSEALGQHIAAVIPQLAKVFGVSNH